MKKFLVLESIYLKNKAKGIWKQKQEKKGIWENRILCPQESNENVD